MVLRFLFVAVLIIPMHSEGAGDPVCQANFDSCHRDCLRKTGGGFLIGKYAECEKGCNAQASQCQAQAQAAALNAQTNLTATATPTPSKFDQQQAEFDQKQKEYEEQMAEYQQKQGEQAAAREALQQRQASYQQQAGMLNMSGTLLTTIGGLLIASNCPHSPSCTTGWWFVGVGGATMVAGFMRQMQASKQQGGIDYLAPPTAPTMPSCFDPSCFGGDLPPGCDPFKDDPATCGGGGPTPTTGGRDNPLARMAADDLEKAREALKNAGISSMSDLKRAMANGAGVTAEQAMAMLTPEQKAKLEKAQKDAIAKYGVHSMDSEGGGGGGRMVASRGKDSDFDLMSFLKKPGDEGKGPSADGLFKQYNGDSIGVASDDIFKMISRRYDKKKASGQFTSAAPALEPRNPSGRLLGKPLKK